MATDGFHVTVTIPKIVFPPALEWLIAGIETSPRLSRRVDGLMREARRAVEQNRRIERMANHD